MCFVLFCFFLKNNNRILRVWLQATEPVGSCFVLIKVNVFDELFIFHSADLALMLSEIDRVRRATIVEVKFEIISYSNEKRCSMFENN